MRPAYLAVAFVGMALLQAAAAQAHSIEVEVTVPPFKLTEDDSYLCVSALLPPAPHKLVGVIPHAKQEVVHHILLYGCAEPHLLPVGKDPAVWRCDMQPVCNGPSSTILYGWGRNAPDLRLPEGVGFSVGANTGVKYIVAQVHYLTMRPDDDHSGVTLLLKPHAVPYAAGLVSYASWFAIPPGKPDHPIINTCCFKSHQPLTAFAVRVHTHALGRGVTLERETWNRTGNEVLVSRDPQAPQSFVPTPHKYLLWPGDKLTTTCHFDSTSRTAPTNAGGTHNDEMCNLYLMVYGKTPYITLCNDNTQDIRDDLPGALPRQATVVADPSPSWAPPKPEGDPAISLGPLGDATSVTTGPDGTLWVLYRATGVWRDDTFDKNNRITQSAVAANVVVNMDPDTGKILKRWGAGVFYLPHSITVDQYGNVWVVDTGRHQVLKFTSDGELLLTAGEELVAGAGETHLCMPTQVAVMRDGKFLVADGYCNDRVVIYKPDGTFLGESPRIRRVVHTLLLDECERIVYVGSREAGTVVALKLSRTLDLQATYDLTAQKHGKVWALRFGPYGEQLALAWTEGQDARLVNVKFPTEFWTLPGTAQLSPHDFVIGGAPTGLSGAGDRFFAVYMASVGVACDTKCGPLHKFVVVPPGAVLPSAWELSFQAAGKDVHPGDAQELPHGTVVAVHKAVAASGGGADAKAVEETVRAANTTAVVADGEPGEDGGEDKGGAMVADDYDEDVEGDKESAEDYEEEKELEEEEEEMMAEAEADYEEMITGVRPNITVGHHAAPAPLLKDRYEVIVQDASVVKKSTASSPWAVVLIIGLAVAMMATVWRFSGGAIKAFVQSARGRGSAVPGTMTPARPAAAAGGIRGSLAAAEALFARLTGRGGGAAAGGGGGGAAAASGGGAPGGSGGEAGRRELDAARERERLLRSAV